jgi:hypothetical protein
VLYDAYQFQDDMMRPARIGAQLGRAHPGDRGEGWPTRFDKMRRLQTTPGDPAERGGRGTGAGLLPIGKQGLDLPLQRGHVHVASDDQGRLFGAIGPLVKRHELVAVELVDGVDPADLRRVPLVVRSTIKKVLKSIDFSRLRSFVHVQILEWQESEEENIAAHVDNCINDAIYGDFSISLLRTTLESPRLLLQQDLSWWLHLMQTYFMAPSIDVLASPSPDVAAADATTEAPPPAADSAAAAAADAQGGTCFGLAPPQDGGTSPQSASSIASALAWAIVDEAVAPLPDA